MVGLSRLFFEKREGVLLGGIVPHFPETETNSGKPGAL
jgi:hypothetical protein